MKRLLLALLLAPALLCAQSSPIGSTTTVTAAVAAPGAGGTVVNGGTKTGYQKVILVCAFTAGAPVALDATNIALNYGGANFAIFVPPALNVPTTHTFDRVAMAGGSASLLVVAIAAATAGVTYTCSMTVTPVS